VTNTRCTNRRRRQPSDYFARFRPQGDTLRAKAARAQIETDKHAISLPRLRFLDLSFEELAAEVADEKRGRS
jgi:hypothetical protein